MRRIAEPINNLMNECFPSAPQIEVLFVQPIDIPEYVAKGVVSSGTTLEINKLRVVEELLSSTTNVIANRDALREKTCKEQGDFARLWECYRCKRPVLSDAECR